MDNNNLFVYINRIINHVIYWKDRLHLTEQQGFKVSDKSINELRKRLRPFIEKIIKSGKDYLLTEDFCYYLVYESFKMVDYQKELLGYLNELKDLDDKKLTKLYRKYFDDILFDKYLKEFDDISCYTDRMEGDYKDAFLTLKSDSDNLHNIFIRGYEHDLLDQISSLIFARCAKTGNLGLYNKLSRPYFTDPRQTIDYFAMNGFIDSHYELVDDFDNYIYKGLNEDNKNSNIIR